MRYPFKKDSVFESLEFTIGKTGTRCWKVANFLSFFRKGMRERYPICCVLHFSLDNIHRDRHPAIERGIIFPATEKSYVPCRFHMRRHPTWTPWYKGHYHQLRLFSDEIGKT